MSEPTSWRVLVTGGAGFIGCALATAAAAESERWVAVDTLDPHIHAQARRPDRLPAAAELVVGDVNDAALWDQLIPDLKPDVIIHLAAETDTGLSLENATRFSNVNVTGTAAMLDALTRHLHRPRRLVLASSRAVYGEGAWRDTVTGAIVPRRQRNHAQLAQGAWDFAGSEPLASRAGETPERPANVYGVTKLAQEGLLSAWAGATGVPLSILRLQNVYGPGQSLINPYTGILALFMRLAAAGRSIEVYEDGAMRRDFIHIDDVARAFVAELHAGTADHIADIGGGHPVTVLEVARFIANESNAPEPRVTGAYRDGDIRHAWCEPASGKDSVGWRPSIDWRTGIRSYLHWYAADARKETA